MSEQLKSKIENIKKDLQDLKRFIHFEDKSADFKVLEQMIKGRNFWQKEKEPSKIQENYKTLSEILNKIWGFEKELADLNELLGLTQNSIPQSNELEEKLDILSKDIQAEFKKALLSGKYDSASAVISIQAGAGGRDAEDWVCLLLRMYEKYIQEKRWGIKILYQQFGEAGGPEGRIGIKEAVLEVKGNFAYGFLKKETGVHRLVRLSPFSAKKLRHTSFAKVEVLPKVKEAETQIILKPDDLKIETFRSSGPGGQNVNRRETAVRITHLPTGFKAASQVERLQSMNRKIALELLLAKLVQKQDQEKNEELRKIKDKDIVPSFGNQIRSYILHPYQLVKDHRTQTETSDVERVLEGDLDKFIEAELKLL